MGVVSSLRIVVELVALLQMYFSEILRLLNEI